MSDRMEPSRRDLILSSLGGLCQGIAVRIFVHPLDVIRTIQQVEPKSSCFHVASNVLKQGGFSSFYKGLSPKLCSTSIKQLFVWPSVICLPDMFNKRSVLEKQVYTGLVCGTIDAIVSTPFERAKIQKIVNVGNTGLIRNGWKGFGTSWTKSSLGYTSFFVSQRLIRDTWGEPQTACQLLQVSTATSLVLTLITAPFEKIFALKAAKNEDFRKVWTSGGFRSLFHGSPLRFLDLFIQSTASIALIRYLEKR